MIHICDKCGYAGIDIMSCEQKDKNIVEITYICPMCGRMETETRYLYTAKQKLKIH